jgi:hypothetical protein
MRDKESKYKTRYFLKLKEVMLEISAKSEQLLPLGLERVKISPDQRKLDWRQSYRAPNR